MNKKYHLTKNGPEPCAINKKKCHIHSPHGGLKEVNQIHVEQLEKNCSILKKVSEKIHETNKLLALKDMDATLLSSELKYAFPSKSISIAIDLSGYIHRNQRRTLAGKLSSTAYIDHPLRVALRLSRYGVNNKDIITAAILHDTVEDGREELAVLLGDSLNDEITMQHNAAVKTVETLFNPIVAEIVNGVSNNPIPVIGSREEKNKAYFDKVSEAIKTPEVCLVKFSDFVDNAVGLYHAFDSKLPLTDSQVKGVSYRAVKYYQIIEEFEKELPNVRGFVTEKGYNKMQEHITVAYTRLKSLTKI